MDITSIDIGYGWTKASRNGVIFCEPSVLGEAKPLYDANKKDGYLIYDDYFVGELALRHSDVKYYSLKESKANTWTTEILLKTALSYLEATDTSVVTGLPIDFYFNQKGDFESLLDSIKGKESSLNILGQHGAHKTLTIRDHKIVPQPLGAAMNYLLDDNCQLIRRDIAKKNILVVDWGRFTLDLLVLDGMEIHKASCSPPDMGIEVAYKTLSRHLRDNIGSNPSPYDMDVIVSTGEYKGYDISDLINRAFKSAAQQIQLIIEGLNLHFEVCVIVGGQADRLGSYLDVSNKVIGNQLSNLNGYEKIGRRTWGKI